jgi:3-oxoadipate enol-lactonase
MTSGIRTGRTLVAGVRLAFREFGPTDGVAVLALHGLASRARSWDRIALQLAGRGRRVIALDQRGHGRSSWPGRSSFAQLRDDVLAFMDARQLDSVDLLGHSMGGMVATLVAMRAPGRVRRLVLEDPPAPLREPVPEPVAVTDRPGATRALIATLPNLLLLARLPSFDPRIARPIIAELRVADPGWWDGLAAISGPALLLGGGPGSHVPQERIAQVAQALPDARLVTFPDAGHRIHSTCPDAFASAVLPFLSPPEDG